MDTPVQQVVNHYLETLGYDIDDIKSEAKKDKRFYARHLRPAKDLIVLAGSVKKANAAISKLAEWADGNSFDYNINTVIKRWLHNELWKTGGKPV